MDYAEADCTFAHAGQGYVAGGAIITALRIIAYPGPGNVLQDWHGRPLGRWRAVASWRQVRRNPDRIYQIEAVVAGVTYTGRGLGQGMIFSGRRKRRP